MQVYYYVQWRGYGDEEASWEPVTHLRNCQDKIREYEDSLKGPRQSPSELQTGKKTKPIVNKQEQAEEHEVDKILNRKEQNGMVSK